MIKSAKRIICMFLAGCLWIQIFGVNVYAQETSPQITTTVTITDIETGDVKKYQVDNVKTLHGVDDEGNEISTAVVEIGDNKGLSRAGQSNYDDFSGWRGTVTISYTDDGTRACLKQATGNWTRKSGSTSISGLSLAYGQVLGTNSKNGKATMIAGSTTKVQTSWAAGKYGLGVGHFLGANIGATIGGKYVLVVCNVDF